MPKSKDVQISKFMSFLLRHGLNERNIKMQADGYIHIDDLMNQPEMKDTTIEDVRLIVQNSDKQRYAINENELGIFIRANQGHSKEVGDKIADNKLLTEIKEALPVCVHGTDRKAWKLVSGAGLSAMKRKHIHLASGLPDDADVKSGMRKSASVLIYIDMQKAMDRGKKFYLSDNGVILTADDLEPDLFAKVEFK